MMSSCKSSSTACLTSADSRLVTPTLGIRLQLSSPHFRLVPPGLLCPHSHRSLSCGCSRAVPRIWGLLERSLWHISSWVPHQLSTQPPYPELRCQDLMIGPTPAFALVSSLSLFQGNAGSPCSDSGRQSGGLLAAEEFAALGSTSGCLLSTFDSPLMCASRVCLFLLPCPTQYEKTSEFIIQRLDPILRAYTVRPSPKRGSMHISSAELWPAAAGLRESPRNKARGVDALPASCSPPGKRTEQDGARLHKWGSRTRMNAAACTVPWLPWGVHCTLVSASAVSASAVSTSAGLGKGACIV